MTFIKGLLAIFFTLLIVFVAHVLISSGFFRTIHPKFEGNILKKIALPGAEDIVVNSVDSFVVISSTDRSVFPRRSNEKGGLYWIDLKGDDYLPIHLTKDFEKNFAPHGISLLQKDSSTLVMAISHIEKGHTIEVFQLFGQNLIHKKTITDPSLISPNDLVIVDENRFYFTNDHRYSKGLGKIVEEYSGISISNVIYYDGKDFREVADGIAYANGINIDRKRNLLFVASPRKFLVKVYSIKPDGALTFIENIDCGTGVDNIELDEAGNLWIGCHPNLLRFSAYAKGRKKTSPSEIIKINYRAKGDYSVEQIYVSEGEDMSGSTVAAPFGNLIFTGNVKDEAFLILEQQQ